MRIILKLLALVVVLCAIGAFMITRDGELVTPQGEGTVTLDVGSFEAFPLPDYAAKAVSSDYKSYFVDVERGIKVHVLEVGTGYPVFLQHGNPTSGFLYRKIAQALPTDQVRLIMPTMVGLGFSSKVPASQHQLDNHVRWINSVLTQLQISELVYVGQDWGGPVGMGALAKSPGLLKGAVVMNTGFNAPTQKMDLSPAHGIVKTPVVGELLLDVVFPLFEQLPRLQGDPASISEETIELYGRPVRESGNTKAPVALMRMVTDGPDHPSISAMRAIEAYVKTLDIPVELIWGMKDPVLAQGLEPMKLNFPDAPVTKTEAGHFLQEEVAQDIAAAVMRIVDQVK
ncbi:MAG: alpha/beta fold hydrolase [Halioglobus sp.]